MGYHDNMLYFCTNLMVRIITRWFDQRGMLAHQVGFNDGFICNAIAIRFFVAHFFFELRHLEAISSLALFPCIIHSFSNGLISCYI
jgi:hypothetical protein